MNIVAGQAGRGRVRPDRLRAIVSGIGQGFGQLGIWDGKNIAGLTR
jgi:hypothetical protein